MSSSGDQSKPASTSPQGGSQKPQEELSGLALIRKSAIRALGGGTAGAAAMTIQVCSLMWLRTVMNYQYRHGTTTTQAFKTLYKEGGVPRLYKGLIPALAQGPLSRFGDTAANAGVIMYLNANPATESLPIGIKTLLASSAAASWRIALMPIDTVKTSMQVEGAKGIPILVAKYRASGISVFFHGALAASGATLIGHLPWFTTYNFLDEKLPKATDTKEKVLRSACMGFSASIVSDTISNSARVIKTTKQTFETSITYVEAVKKVVEKDGIIGLFGRGLKTRILANGMQGLLFSVLWRLIDDALFKKPGDTPQTSSGSKND